MRCWRAERGRERAVGLTMPPVFEAKPPRVDDFMTGTSDSGSEASSLNSRKMSESNATSRVKENGSSHAWRSEKARQLHARQSEETAAKVVGYSPNARYSEDTALHTLAETRRLSVAHPGRVFIANFTACNYYSDIYYPTVSPFTAPTGCLLLSAKRRVNPAVC